MTQFLKNPAYKSINTTRYEPNNNKHVHTATIRVKYSPDKPPKNITLMVGLYK